MEAQATLRGVRMGPRKMRVVAGMVRGRHVTEAMGDLQLMTKKAAGIIAKVLNSAVANAEDRSDGAIEVDDLRIKEIYVDGGSIRKGYMPRAMGRGNRINHRTSHVTVVVSDED